MAAHFDLQRLSSAAFFSCSAREADERARSADRIVLRARRLCRRAVECVRSAVRFGGGGLAMLEAAGVASASLVGRRMSRAVVACRRVEF